MNKYLIIDENGICCGTALTSGEIDDNSYILVAENFDPTNKRWNGESWEDYTPPEPPAPEPDKLDLILEEVRKSSEDIVSETEAAYEAALNEAYEKGVNSL